MGEGGGGGTVFGLFSPPSPRNLERVQITAQVEVFTEERRHMQTQRRIQNICMEALTDKFKCDQEGGSLDYKEEDFLSSCQDSTLRQHHL